jgi:hypothetical protein
MLVDVAQLLSGALAQSLSLSLSLSVSLVCMFSLLAMKAVLIDASTHSISTSSVFVCSR